MNHETSSEFFLRMPYRLIFTALKYHINRCPLRILVIVAFVARPLASQCAPDILWILNVYNHFLLLCHPPSPTLAIILLLFVG
jgi:hypothetical protein